MHYYQFYIGDYAKDCRHLSWDEDLAYRRLLDAYYAKEEPLPSDYRSIYRLVCAQTDSQREAVNTVLNEFFVETPEGWRNSKADNEISAFKEKSKKASASARIRWDGKKKPSQIDRNANASLDKCERTNTLCEGNANNEQLTINNESNKKQDRFDALRHLVSLGVVEQVARDWIKQRKTKPTLTAIKGIEKEAIKARLSLHQALEISCSRGWQSFKAEWIQDKTNTLTPNQSAWLTITGQIANFGDDNHGRTIEADPLPPALLG